MTVQKSQPGQVETQSHSVFREWLILIRCLALGHRGIWRKHPDALRDFVHYRLECIDCGRNLAGFGLSHTSVGRIYYGPKRYMDEIEKKVRLR